jgi:hypothetical protein
MDFADFRHGGAGKERTNDVEAGSDDSCWSGTFLTTDAASEADA